MTAISDTIPPHLLVDPDGGPRLFFEWSSCEFLSVDDLGYVPTELRAELDAWREAEQVRRAEARRRQALVVIEAAIALAEVLHRSAAAAERQAPTPAGRRARRRRLRALVRARQR